jgi:hypothetical protein
VKRLTGGDKITARRMHEDFWDFDPSHSIVMHTNHKPVVRGTDEGIWRRLRLVPFDVVIPEDERDGKLPDQLALGVDGILAWLVDGYRQWQDRGLAEPEQVRTATDAFRGESDMLGLFLDERCMTSPMDTSDRRSCSPRGRRGASARTPTPALTPHSHGTSSIAGSTSVTPTSATSGRVSAYTRTKRTNQWPTEGF